MKWLWLAGSVVVVMTIGYVAMNYDAMKRGQNASPETMEALRQVTDAL